MENEPAMRGILPWKALEKNLGNAHKIFARLLKNNVKADENLRVSKKRSPDNEQFCKHSGMNEYDSTAPREWFY